MAAGHGERTHAVSFGAAAWFGATVRLGAAVLLGLAAALITGCASTAADTSISQPERTPGAAVAGPAIRPEPTPSAAGPAGTGGPNAGGSAANAAPGATGTTPGSSASAGGAGGPGQVVPTDQGRAVFVGEPCVPELDAAPRPAVGGLLLYCSQPGTGRPRWDVASPPTELPGAPSVGDECLDVDTGQVARGADGRPLVCLRDTDGTLRWSDIS